MAAAGLDKSVPWKPWWRRSQPLVLREAPHWRANATEEETKAAAEQATEVATGGGEGEGDETQEGEVPLLRSRAEVLAGCGRYGKGEVAEASVAEEAEVLPEPTEVAAFLTKARVLPPPLIRPSPVWLLSPPPRPVCLAFLVGECPLGESCPGEHPQGEAALQLRQHYSKQPCHYGISCQRTPCLFYHPEAKQELDKDGSTSQQEGDAEAKDDEVDWYVKQNYGSESEGSRSEDDTEDEEEGEQLMTRHFLQNDEEEELLARAARRSVSACEDDGGSEEKNGTTTQQCVTALVDPKQECKQEEGADADMPPEGAVAALRSLPQEFARQKEEPTVLLYGPDCAVASKPSGWSAAVDDRPKQAADSTQKQQQQAKQEQPQKRHKKQPLEEGELEDSEEESEEDDEEAAAEEKTVEEEEEEPPSLTMLSSSGFVEPLLDALPQLRHSRSVLPPSASCSGCVLLAESDVAEKWLRGCCVEGRLTFVSLAMVPGKMSYEKQAASARRADGALEVNAIAGYKCVPGSEHEGSYYYTLLLLRSNGAACGGECGLLQKTWGGSVVGEGLPTMTKAEHQDPVATALGRPFLHVYGVSIAAGGAGDPGFSVVAPLPADLRQVLSALTPEFGFEDLHSALVSVGRLPADSKHARHLHEAAEPKPYGMGRWQNGQKFRGYAPGNEPLDQKSTWQEWVRAFIAEALKEPTRYGLACGQQGELRIEELYRRFPCLEEACYVDPALIIRFVRKDPMHRLELCCGNHAVRLMEPERRLQAIVEAYACRMAPGEYLTLSELKQNSLVRALVAEPLFPKEVDAILEVLKPGTFFSVHIQKRYLRLHPIQVRVRLLAEQLMASPDELMKSKLKACRGQGVPLAWFVYRYAEKLGPKRVKADEAAEALEISTKLSVSADTLRMSHSAEEDDDGKQQLPPPCPSHRARFVDRRFTARCTVKALEDLLNFYFDPFTLQYSRLILFVAEDIEDKWQWRLPVIEKRLARIKQIMERLPRRNCLLQHYEGGAKQGNVVCVKRPEDGELCLELTYAANLRMPVLLPAAPEWVQAHFTLPKEESDKVASADGVVVLSLALRRNDLQLREQQHDMGPSERQKWHRQIMRMLRAWQPDVICLQHCQADGLHKSCCNAGVDELASGKGSDMLASLVEMLHAEDFEYCAAPVKPLADVAPLDKPSWPHRANVIFWRRGGLAMQNWRATDRGAVLAELQPRGSQRSFGVCCMEGGNIQDARSQLETTGVEEFIIRHGRVVLCGAFATYTQAVTGGINASSPVGWRSAHKEILGCEMPWTRVAEEAASTEPGEQQQATEGIWIGGSGVTAVAALDAGKVQPSPKMSAVDHIPLVVGLELHGVARVAAEHFQPDALMQQMCGGGAEEQMW